MTRHDNVQTDGRSEDVTIPNDFGSPRPDVAEFSHRTCERERRTFQHVRMA